MKTKRLLAGFMTVVMTVGQLYVPVVAQENDYTEITEYVEENWPATEDIPSEDDLLMGYLMGESVEKNQTTVVETNEEEEVVSEEAGDAAVKAGDSLNPANKCIYDAVVSAYTQIAAGNRADVFVDVVFPDSVKTSFTAEDLGVPVVTGNSINPAATAAAVAQLGLDRTAIYNALYYDQPYLVYWQDASYGMGWSYGYSCSGYVGSEVLSIVNFKWTTSAGIAYRPDGATADDSGRYTAVDTAKTAAAAAAKTNAQNIVTAAKSSCSTDKEILEYYCVEICEMTSYNYDSLSQSNGANFDGAHGVIYALDNNPATQVVCDGYARTFQMLCDMTEFYSDGVSVYRVTGDAFDEGGEGGAHAWNIAVMEDGKGYHIDSTWSDYEYQENAYIAEHNSEEAIKKLLTRYFMLPVTNIDEEANSYTVVTESGSIYTGQYQYVPFDGSESVVFDEGTVSIHPLSFYNMSSEPYAQGNQLTENNTTITISSETYTGNVIDPDITVELNGSALTLGEDYTLSIEQNGEDAEVLNAGVYTAVISGTGAYSGVVMENFTVAAKTITPTVTVTGTYTYTGDEIEPVFSVKDGSTILIADTDYTVSLDNNLYAGTAVITVSMIDDSNYSFNAVEQAFTIAKADAPGVDDIEISVLYSAGTASATITGMPEDAGNLIFAKGNEIVAGDATIDSWSVSDAGVVEAVFSDGEVNDVITLPVTISSDNYEDTTTNVLVILIDKDHADVTVEEGDPIEKEYGDEDFTLTVSQTGDTSDTGEFYYSSDDESVVTVNEDGKVHIVGLGTATITVAYESDTHKGNTVVTLEVLKKPLNVIWNIEDYSYNGTEQGPTAEFEGVVGDDEVTAVVTEYGTVPGAHTAKLSLGGTDAGKYLINDDEECPYFIYKADIADAEVTVDDSVVYNGEEQTVAVVSVMLGNTDITEYCDVTNNKQTNAGNNYEMSVTAKSDSYYTGSIDVPFSIAAKSITPSVTVTGEYYYTGSAIEAEFTVKDGDTILISGKDYNTAYALNTEAGTARITVSKVDGGNYAFDSVSETFTINKAAAPILNDIDVYAMYSSGSAQTMIKGIPVDAGKTVYSKVNQSTTGGVIFDTCKIEGAGKVTVNFSNGAIGGTVGVTVKIESDNYEDMRVDVVVHLIDKYVTEINVAGGNTVNKVYGDADFTPAVSQTEDETAAGEYSFVSSEESVATVDQNGKIHINGAGSTDITIDYESATHKGFTTLTLNVAKKTMKVTWTGTDLVYNGLGQGPEVELEGIVGNDDVIAVLDGYETVPGSYTAELSLGGADVGKYAVSDEDAVCAYTISKAPIANAAVTVDDSVVYNGGEQTVAVVSVMLGTTDITGFCDVSGNVRVNAGNYTMKLSAKSDSYYTGSIDKNFTIAAKSIVPTVTVSGTYEYTGSAIMPVYTVKDGETYLEAGTDYTAVPASNINAGEGTLTVKAVNGGNYAFADKTVKFTISKAQIADKTAAGSARFGKGGSVDLNALIMAGGKASVKSVSDNASALEKAPEIKDGKLEYCFKNDDALARKIVSVNVAVRDADNYQDYEIAVTLTVLECAHTGTEIRGALEANCSEEGYTGDKYCTECGKLLEQGSTIPADPDKHDYDEGKITKEPTVFEEGEKSYTCKRCGHIKTEAIERIPGEEDMSEILDDIDPEKDKVDVITKENEDGSTETVVKVGEEEVSNVVTDTDGTIMETTKIWITGLKSSYTYCGEAIKPEIHVYDGLRRLEEGGDYTLKYSNNKKAGKEAKLTVSFRGNYKSTDKKDLYFEIKPAELGRDVIAKDGAVNVGGKPAVNVIFAASGKKVPSNDLKISYAGDTGAAGTVIAEIRPGSADYSGSTQAVITVIDNRQLMLENARVKTDQKKYTYTGKPISANVTLELDGKELKKGVDYTVSQISNNVEPGTATMVLEAIKGNASGYAGSRIVTFKIVKGRELEKGEGFVFDMQEKQSYEKGGVKPALKVYDGDTLLKEGVDYKLTIKGNKKAGSAGSVTVKGKGKYKGSVTLGFTVEKSDLSKLGIVSVDAVSGVKNGNPWAVIIDVNRKQLKEGADYQMVPDMTSPVGGTYMNMIAKGIGNYTGEVKIWYRELDSTGNIAKIKNAKVAAVPYASGGAVVDKKTIEGLFDGRLSYGKDYVVAGYINNLKPGTAKLVIKGIGEYGGVKLISFKVKGKKGVVKGAYIDGEWK